MKRALLLLSLLMSMSCTETFKRKVKTEVSNYTGGLRREITVYSYTGEVIKQWRGKTDVQFREEETLFDMDGKRVTIHGGIIITEELD